MSLKEYEESNKKKFKNLECEECNSSNIKRTFILGATNFKIQVDKREAIDEWKKIQNANLKSGFEKTDKLRQKIIKQKKVQSKLKSDKSKRKDFKQKYEEEILGPENERKKKEFQEKHNNMFNN